MQKIYQRGSLSPKEATDTRVNICTCLGLILSSIEGCELHMAMPGVEDDYAAAEIAVERNAFGVISDDSDFLCFQVIAICTFKSHSLTETKFKVQAYTYRWASLFIRYRLAFQMGGVKVFSGRDVNTLEVQEYDIDALARYLGIQTNDLPLLAALTGNDMGKE